MIVCHCRRVSDRRIAACIDGGCRTLREVCAATGAGRDCGSCVAQVRTLLHAQRTPALAPTPHPEDLHATA